MTRSVAPDPFTETALRLLPIPPHGERFWEDLDRALDGDREQAARHEAPGPFALPREPVRAYVPAPAADAVDDALALVPPALRRRSNALLVAVAAAAVVLVVFAGSSLVSERSGGDGAELATTDGGSEGTPEALDQLVEDAHPAAATLTTLSSGRQDATAAAVADWVQAVRTGDAAAAWKAMGPASQEHFGSQGAFAAELDAMAEEYGAWADAGDDVVITPVMAADDGDGTLAVVTLLAEVEIDGVAEEVVAAVPVRLLEGEVVLEPFADAGALELVVPEPVEDGERATVDIGDDLVVLVPTGATAPVLRLDDGEIVVCGLAPGSELRAMDDLPMQRCSYLPSTGLAAGAHTLTVAFLGADGRSITADALRFDAA